MPELAIDAAGVHKHYRGTPPGVGLNGFDLAVPAGTVCGLLGPNGSGKTTAIRILATLLRHDSGRVRVAGFDVASQAAQVRRKIGLVGQYAAVDEILTGRQNLFMFARLNHLSGPTARSRAEELLGRFSLGEAGNRPVGKYSGGMRRRLDLAASLLVAPSVLFVDEPTAGLDPQGRSEVWSAVRDLVGGGTTVLLTTQYLEEADQLADQVSMLRAGRVIAEGTPEALKSSIGGDRIDIVLADGHEIRRTAEVVAPVAAGEISIEAVAGRLSLPVADRTPALIEVATRLAGAGIQPLDLTLRRPTLDEVFLHLNAAEPEGDPPRDGPAQRTVPTAQTGTEVPA